MSQTVVEILAQHAHDIHFDKLPPEVIQESKRIILDSIGCALAGRDFQKGEAGRKFAHALGGGGNESSILGEAGRVSAPAAAFANAELINVMDMDVVTFPGHVAPAVVAGVMATGEARCSPGKAIIEAIALGFDVGNRFGRATDNLRDTKDGKANPPAVFGYTSPIFGAAAAVMKLKRQPVEAMANAIGIAGCISPVNSMLSWMEHAPATTIKYTLMGSLAMQAMTAAYMAEYGHRGDLQILDDREFGYPRFIGTTKWEPEHITRDLGLEWKFVGETAYKPYPHCRVFHPLMDAMLEILETHDIQPQEIEGITIFAEGIATERDVWLNTTIDDVHDAQFSMRHGIAVAAHRVPPGKDWLDPALIHSFSVMSLMAKVKAQKHPDFVKMLDDHGASRPGRVEVRARGQVLAGERRFPKGSPSPDPASFMTDAELIAKYRHNAQDCLSDSQIDEIAESVMQLEHVSDFSQVMRLAAGPQARRDTKPTA